MCDELELYALNALPREEQEAFEAHLASCGRCASELGPLQETAALLALTLPEVRPSARLKMNVLALTAAEERVETAAPVVPLRPRRRAAAFLAGAVAASFALGGLVAQQALAPPADPSSPSFTTPPSVPPATTVLDDVLAAEDAATVKKRLASGGEVVVAYSPRLNQGVLSSKALEELPGQQVYQVWLQTPSGSMMPAGHFERGEGALMVIEGDVATAQGLGVTVEPRPGATAPSTPPIVLVSL